MAKKVTQEQAQKAFNTLVAYGAYRLKNPENYSTGALVGLAIASFTNDVVSAANEMLEDWNYHLCVACISAIAGKEHIFKRNGNKITITLSEPFMNYESIEFTSPCKK